MPKKTPWGNADYEYQIVPRSVTKVTTPSHGGLMVSKAWAEKNLSEAALDEAIVFGSYYAFEEDCAYLLVLHESPLVFRAYRDGSPGNISTAELQGFIDTALARWYQDYQAKREGRFTGLQVSRVVSGSSVGGIQEGKALRYQILHPYKDKVREWVVAKFLDNRYIGQFRITWEFIYGLVKHQKFEFKEVT